MRDRPNGPSFHTLRRTSPALNEVLRVCFLRAAFQADPQFSSVRSLSTAATLGTVSHRLLESAARGELDDTLEQNLDTGCRQKMGQARKKRGEGVAEAGPWQCTCSH